MNSHLLARRLYFLAKGSRAAAPLIYAKRQRFSKNSQIRDYAFCTSCEKLFCEEGEKWVIPNLLQPDGTFPLLESTLQSRILHQEAKLRVYTACDNQSIRVERIVHFAASVYWKAAAHEWRALGRPISNHAVEPRLRDQLRSYLLGQADFPSECALVLFLFPHPERLLAAPMKAQLQSGMTVYIFPAPGVQFVLVTGDPIPTFFKKHCFANTPDHPILVSDVASTRLAGFAERYSAS